MVSRCGVRLVTFGTGIDDRLQSILDRQNRRLGRSSGKRVVPRIFPRSIPRIWISPVEPMAVVVTLAHGVLLDERAQGPALQGPIYRAGGCGRPFLLQVGFHWRTS